MSGEEDVELRDLVSQTLETNGVLSKLKAQMLASVFLALDEQDSLKNKSPLKQKEFQKFASLNEGNQVVSLVREFLQFFGLEHSLAVFEAETGSGSKSVGRSSLIKQFGIGESSSEGTPVIAKIVEKFRNERTDNNHLNSSTEKQLSDMEEANVANRTSATLGSLSHQDSTDDDFYFFDSKGTRDKKSDPELQAKNDQFGLSAVRKVHKDQETGSEVDEYEADFQLSNVTPIGQTPRSARSDARTIETETSEEIEEEVEFGDLLVRSDASQLTTDRTLSPDAMDKNGKVDYLEDVLS